MGKSSGDIRGLLSGVSGSCKEGRDVLLYIGRSSENPQGDLDNMNGVGSSIDPRGVLITEAGIDPSSDSREVLSTEDKEDTCAEVTKDLSPTDRDESGSGVDPIVEEGCKTELRMVESEAGAGTESLWL